MKRKVAVPVENGIMTGHFGHAKLFAIIEMDGDQIIKEEYLVPPPHEPGILPSWLSNLGATDILTGGMGQQAINLFLNNHINVYLGVTQKPASELAVDLALDQLVKGANYCDH